MFAFGVFHVVDFHVGMVSGGVGNGFKGDAVEFFCHGEDSFCYGIYGEVGADFVFIEGVFILAHFLGEIIVVPGGDFEVVAELVG